MMKPARLGLGLCLGLLAGCAQVKEKPALPTIRQELAQAAEKPPIRALPPAVEAALAPPAQISLPKAAAAAVEPRFDLSVNNAPASQVFLGIASGTRYSMLLHPDVAGRITVNLKDVTVPEAMQAIRELYGYDYRIDANRVIVQPITAQTRFYTIPYPSAIRQGKSELRVISGSVADNASSSGGTSGASSGAASSASQVDSSRVVTSMQSDFWGELRAMVAMILGCGAGGACPEGRSVVASPAAGMLIVRGLPQEQRMVADYLKSARIQVERQVMIEAKIIEVTLNEGAQAGINWALFNKGLHQASKGADSGQIPLQRDIPLSTSAGGLSTSLNSLIGAGISGAAGTTAANNANAGLFGLAFQATNFALLMEFLETQGGVQVLSSPRIAAINNQKAVLKVGTDEFFVTGITTNNTTSGSNTTSSPTLTVQPFFSGIALDVTPQIDEADDIILHVHPSVSVVTSDDKTINLGTSLGEYTLPLAKSSVSETDSIVRLKDGQIAAIGGLMKRASSDTSSAVPGLGGIPGLGALFSNSAKSRLKQELVILLKPTLIRTQEDWLEGSRAAGSRLDSMAAPSGQ